MAIKTEKIILDLRAEIDKIKVDMKGLKTATSGVNKEVGKLNSLFKKAGLAFVSFFAISKVMQWGNAISNVIKDFQQNMAELSSITGAVGEDLDFMRQKAIELSVQLKKTANDVVKAFQLVGSAKPELLKNAAALAEVTKQAIILSQAAGIDVPDAAKILTGALNLWNKGAKDAAKFTDILADSQKKGSVLIRQIGESLINAGASAAATGLTFAETNVIIQAFGKGMIEGARAGTATDIVLRKLAGLADKELNPVFTDMSTVLENLAKKGYGGDLPKAMKLVGEEAAKYLLTLIAQRGVVKELTGNLGDMGVALEQAEINTATIQGAQDQLTASWQAFILSIESGEGIVATLWEETLLNIANLLDKLSGTMSASDQVLADWGDRFDAVVESTKKANEETIKYAVTLTTLSAELKTLKEDFVEIDRDDKIALKITADKIIAKQAEIKVIRDLLKAKKDVTKVDERQKALLEKWETEAAKGISKELEARKLQTDDLSDIELASVEKLAVDKIAIAKETAEILKEISLELTDEEIQIERYKQESKLAIIGGAFGLAQGLAGESFLVQKLLAIAESIIATLLGAQLAYTALAGIPVIGPELAKAARRNALITGFANTAMIAGVAIAGLEEGGFTGKGKWVDQKGKRIAGIVHEDEFVFNQEKTAVLRPFFEDIHHDRIDIRGLAALTRRGVMTPIINNKLNADILEREVRKIYQKMSEETDNSSETPFNGGIMKRRGSVTTIIK